MPGIFPGLPGGAPYAPEIPRADRWAIGHRRLKANLRANISPGALTVTMPDVTPDEVAGGADPFSAPVLGQ